MKLKTGLKKAEAKGKGKGKGKGLSENFTVDTAVCCANCETP